MKRPARLRILGKQFKVDFVPPTHATLQDGKDRLVGFCDNEAQHIHVALGQPIESEQDTVLHEVLHAIDAAMGDEEAQEKVIRRLATGLLAVIKDNPRFLSYLRCRGDRETTVQETSGR